MHTANPKWTRWCIAPSTFAQPSQPTEGDLRDLRLHAADAMCAWENSDVLHSCAASCSFSGSFFRASQTLAAEWTWLKVAACCAGLC